MKSRFARPARRLWAWGIGPALLCQAAMGQAGPAPVSVSKVAQRDVALGRPFVGTVQPLRTSRVGSVVENRVVEFAVREGDQVTRGQTLARLRTTTLEIEKDAAVAELQLRKSELAELKNGSRPEEIEQARAKMLAAQAKWDYSKTDFDRIHRLYQSNNAANDEMDLARSMAVQTEQEYTDAKAAYELAVAGPRRERVDQADARVRAQEEEVRRLEDLIAEHTVAAPFDGYVVAEHVEVGEWVSRGQAIVDLIELDQVDIQAMVVEDYVNALRIGTSARIEVGSLPDESFVGEVVRIVPHADVRSRSFPVKVRVANREQGGLPLLKSGMFARMILPVGEKEQALLVPKDALVLGGGAPMVYAISPGQSADQSPTVRPVAVEIGVASGNLIQVKGDLQPDDMVVVQGNERLRPGQAVRITEVMETAPVPADQSSSGSTASVE